MAARNTSFGTVLVVAVCLFVASCKQQTSTDCFDIARELDANPASGKCAVSGTILPDTASYFIGSGTDMQSSDVVVGLNGPIDVWIDEIDANRGVQVRIEGRYEILDGTLVSIRVIEAITPVGQKLIE